MESSCCSTGTESFLLLQSVVKLADFGVAAKLTGASDGDESLTQSVVGTPYWMAPEVIEMTSVTAAADIWSVGCLTIELLTGQPPYFDLQPMSALFRIVQVGTSFLQEGVQPTLEDMPCLASNRHLYREQTKNL